MKTLIFITTLFLLIGCGYNATGPTTENDSLNIIDTVVDNDTTDFYMFRLFIAPIDGSSGNYEMDMILTDSVTDVVTIEKKLPRLGRITDYRVPRGKRVQMVVGGVSNQIPELGTWKGHIKLAPFYNVRIGDKHITLVER